MENVGETAEPVIVSETANEEDAEDVAAAMGFGSFGAKPHLNKKRKTEAQHHALTPQPSLPARPNASQHNANIPHRELGNGQQRLPPSSRHSLTDSVPAESLPQLGERHSSGGYLPRQHGGTADIPDLRGSQDAGKRADGEWDWYALRRGVIDEHGDTAFYDRSFVEDPWEALRKK